jgi:rhomboid protease GluP
MNQPVSDPLEAILYQCAQAMPRPWYPRHYAESIGVHRDTLDPFLERLRLRGLISLTPWEKDLGQGYTLTAEGKRVLYNPHLLARLRDGTLPAAPPPEEAQLNLRDAPGTAYGRGEQIRNALRSPAPPVLTYLLIAANVVVFLAGLYLAVQQGIGANVYLYGDALEVTHLTGALTASDLVRGQWWRLLSCCFVHFGLLHLGVNMYSLYVVGPLMEKMWGRWRFLVIYFFAGLGGSIAMVLFTPHVLGGGASGALWGLMAGLGAWVYLNRRFLPPPLASTWLRQIGTIFVLNVIISLMPGISAAAHFGGGAVGLVTAGLLHYHRYATSPGRWLALAGALLVPVLCVGVLLQELRTDPRLRQLQDVLGELREKTEVERLYKEVLPVMKTQGNQALDVYANEAKPLLEKQWQRRDPATIEKALAALAEGRAKLRQALDVVQKSGPYTSPQGLKVSQECLDFLEANIKRFELAERCLRDGEQWTEKDEQTLAEQTERASKALQHLNELPKDGRKRGRLFPQSRLGMLGPAEIPVTRFVVSALDW